ncbi:MAG: HAMP domain-containing sensor histidine kinase [Arenimonas sp.]
MLHEFLSANRADLIERCRTKVMQRSPGVEARELEFGISPFLDQLIKTLQIEQGSNPTASREVSGPAGGQPVKFEMGGTATEHGRELLDQGYSIQEVVHDYGDLCQAITDLAVERSAAIETDEFRTLNRCLDNAIAVAVAGFTNQRDSDQAQRHAADENQRLGILAHEMRNLVTTATLAVHIIKSGNVGLTGATGQILDRSLLGLVNLIDRSLSEVRVSAGHALIEQSFSLSGMVAELKITAGLAAKDKGCLLIVANVAEGLCLRGDRQLLLAATGNLLQNAFKFTLPGTEVTLNAYASGERILIDVEDNCGGLPHGDVESLFIPFSQHGHDRSGAGLGLAISRRSVEANGGTLVARDVAGRGCVFTINLPLAPKPAARHAPAPTV